MSSPPHSPSLETLGERPFSFYPPILNIEHNEWQFRKTTWSEVLVLNRKTGSELWIPRRYFGEISRVDEPVVIVGLNRELEYKGGTVWPAQRRVIEMPLAGAAIPAPARESTPPHVEGLRSQPPTDVRALRLIGITLLVGIAAYFAMASVFRQGVLRPRVTYTVGDQSYLDLRGYDDYYGIVNKLGRPAADRWMSETGELQYRALVYPQRKFTVILMGTDRKSATYIGALDDNWKPVHSVPFRSGGNTFSLLRELKRF